MGLVGWAIAIDDDGIIEWGAAETFDHCICKVMTCAAIVKHGSHSNKNKQTKRFIVDMSG